MSKKMNLLVSAMALAATPLAFASNSNVGFEKSYLGAEVMQTKQEYKTGFGDNLFKKDSQNYSVFGGFNFWKCFGLEAGYQFQPRISKSGVTIPVGGVIAGASPVIAGDNPVLNSYTENQGPYFGFFADTDKKVGSGKINFKALLGLFVNTVKANYTFTSIANLASNDARDFKNTKAVFMAKLTSSYIFSNNVGVRLSLNYRNMAAFKINAQQNVPRTIKLKDMFGVGLGLTYSF